MPLTQCVHQMLVSTELGGAGRIAVNIAKYLHENVRESRVWVPGPGTAEEKAKELGLISHFYDGSEVFSSSRIKVMVRNWKLRQAFYPYRGNLIHVHSPLHYGSFSSGIKASRLTSVVHIHLQEEEDSLAQTLRTPPNIIITCAEFLVDYVRKTLPLRHQESQRIVCIRNAVDTERFRPGKKADAKQKIGVPANALLVVMVANIAPHKGQETVIRVAANLKREGISPLFWLVGDERNGKRDYTSYLRSLSVELGVADRVCFVGSGMIFQTYSGLQTCFCCRHHQKVFRCPFWKRRRAECQSLHPPRLEYPRSSSMDRQAF